MATGVTGLLTGATTKAGLPAVNPFLGFFLVTAATFLDSKYTFPILLGDRNKARPRELLGLPTLSANPGEPRVWAIGRRVRVPLHVFFQSNKTRESSAGGAKAGQAAGTIRRVFADVGLVINDRPTPRLTQLIGNGKLLFWTDRNLQLVKTHGMTMSATGSNLLLTMASTFEPDFADKFEAGDRALISNALANGGPSVNGYWKVVAVTKHGSTPSTMTLSPYGGQTVTGLLATPGTEQFPATIARVDDAFVEHAITGSIGGSGVALVMASAAVEQFDKVFVVGDRVALHGWTTGAGPIPTSLEFVVAASNVTHFASGPGNGRVLLNYQSGGFLSGPPIAGTSTNAGVIRFFGAAGASYVPGLFASDPSLHYHEGTEDQTEDSIIARSQTSGTIPGFRHMAYQMLDQIDLSAYFGSSLPIFEGIVEPDPNMTWRGAIAEICARYQIDESRLDLAGVTPRPFEGMYLLGGMPGAQALQPILIAGQIVTQERPDGVLAFFEIANADVVQIENGAAFSDLSARSGSGTPDSGDKIREGRVEFDGLPKRMEVKHQDVDNVYAQGSQPFGVRNPSASTKQTEDVVDLSMMAMTRKQAKNIATEVVRRTWVNSRTVEIQLPFAYCELVENDMVTVTADDGSIVKARTIRIDIGANWIASIVAVREHADLAVAGSPVQRPVRLPPIVQLPAPIVHIMDTPSPYGTDIDTPGVFFVACAPRGGQWAGVSVYESRDGGTSYQLATTISQQSGVGVTDTDLDAGDHGEDAAGTVTWDTVNSFDIQLDNDGLWPIATVTEADVLVGLNWFLVDAGGGNFEILGARDVTDNGGGSFTLSHLLRGLRGTYGSADATKAAGARVVALFQALPTFHALDDTDVPISRSFKFLAPGQSLAEAEEVAITIEGWNARPMPVRDFDLTGTTDRLFTMRHWTRQAMPIGSVGPFPLDEAFEGYRLRIFDPTGATLLRVKHRDARGTGSPTLASPTFAYSAAEQTADGYTPGGSETFWIELEQLGDFGTDTSSGTPQRRGGRFYRQEV